MTVASTHLPKKRYFNNSVCCQISQQKTARFELTISVELIPRVNGKNIYDEKVAMQLSSGEVAVFLDVLLMYREEFNPKYHGTITKDKMLVVRNQKDGLFVFMGQSSTERSLTFVIEEDNRYELLTLVSSTLAERDNVNIKDVLDISRTLAQRRSQIQTRGKA